MSIAASLDQEVSAVCPIYGVGIGRVSDKSTWRIDFKPEATDEQRKAAQGVLAKFDPSVAEIRAVSVDELVAALKAKGLLSDADVVAALASADPV